MGGAIVEVEHDLEMLNYILGRLFSLTLDTLLQALSTPSFQLRAFPRFLSSILILLFY